MAENNAPNPPAVADSDKSMQLAVIGHLLKAEQSQTASTIEVLAQLLKAAIPDRIEIVLGGRFWHKVRPVEELTINLDGEAYHISKSKHGAPTVTKRKIVRDITLKSSVISMEQCINEVVARLSELEKTSDATRVALNNFIYGR